MLTCRQGFEKINEIGCHRRSDVSVHNILFHKNKSTEIILNKRFKICTGKIMTKGSSIASL